MYISKETAEQTEKRLLSVLAQAEFRVYEVSYAFEEFPLDDLERKISNTALAFVRDDGCWSQLIPCEDPAKELFQMVGFHFPANLDNSGFVGWLATHCKQKFGTGVFVVCGQNSGRGGIYDYWGCPYAIGESFVAEIAALMERGRLV